LIVGFARNMNGTVGEKAQEAVELKDKLEQCLQCNVKLIDERLTSKMAENVLISGDVSRAKRKQKIDKLAASLILQTYLELQGD